MSAVTVLLKQSEAIIATDAAVYTPDGVLSRVVQKTFVFPAQKLAIASMGMHMAGITFAERIAGAFGSFDQLVDEIELAIRPLIGDQLEEWKEHGAPMTASTLYIAGYSDARGRPESYTMNIADEEETDAWVDYARRTGSRYSGESFVLQTNGRLVCNPPVTGRQLTIAGVDQRGTDDEIRERLSDDDLLAILEIQRRDVSSVGRFHPDLSDTSWVGGYALITSITRDCISQRVIHRWPDVVGEPINVEPMDWQAWRAPRRREMMNRDDVNKDAQPLTLGEALVEGAQMRAQATAPQSIDPPAGLLKKDAFAYGKRWAAAAIARGATADHAAYVAFVEETTPALIEQISALGASDARKDSFVAQVKEAADRHFRSATAGARKLERQLKAGAQPDAKKR